MTCDPAAAHAKRSRMRTRLFRAAAAIAALVLLVGLPRLHRPRVSEFPDTMVLRRPVWVTDSLGIKGAAYPEVLSSEGGDSSVLLDPSRCSMMWSTDSTTGKLELRITEAVGVVGRLRVWIRGSYSLNMLATYRETTPFDDGATVRVRRDRSGS